LLVAWPVEVFLSSLSGRGYNHYFVCWLPVLGLLCAFTMYYYGNRVNSILSSRPAGLIYGFLILVLLLGSPSVLKTYSEAAFAWITERKLPEHTDPVVSYVQRHTKPNETVLVWGAQAGINFVSGRRAPSAYFLYPLFLPSPVTIPMADRFLADLRTNPPALIVDTYFFEAGTGVFYSLDPETRLQQQINVRPESTVYTAHNLGQVFDFIESNYRLETSIDSVRIYRLVR
jgi:hypothetical protein